MPFFEETLSPKTASTAMCLSCGKSKGKGENQCSKTDGPECKERVKEKTRDQSAYQSAYGAELRN